MTVEVQPFRVYYASLTAAGLLAANRQPYMPLRNRLSLAN
jgi:hypothetical protein